MKPVSATDALPEPAEPAASQAQQSHRKSLDSRVLFAGGNELVIFHYGEPYRLRNTRQGKLILTK